MYVLDKTKMKRSRLMLPVLALCTICSTSSTQAANFKKTEIGLHDMVASIAFQMRVYEPAIFLHKGNTFIMGSARSIVYPAIDDQFKQLIKKKIETKNI